MIRFFLQTSMSRGLTTNCENALIIIATATSLRRRSQRHSREGANPGRVTVQGETISGMGKSLEDKMDGAKQSRVERSLWRDMRLDWIPAFAEMML
jgi:hypothetical protein